MIFFCGAAKLSNSWVLFRIILQFSCFLPINLRIEDLFLEFLLLIYAHSIEALLSVLAKMLWFGLNWLEFICCCIFAKLFKVSNFSLLFWLILCKLLNDFKITYKNLILFFLEFIMPWFVCKFKKFVGVIFRDISCCWWDDEAAR